MRYENTAASSISETFHSIVSKRSLWFDVFDFDAFDKI